MKWIDIITAACSNLLCISHVKILQLTWKQLYCIYSRSKSAIVTNTTVEISVPEEVIHCVYGENGRNLARLRQVSTFMFIYTNIFVSAFLASSGSCAVFL